MLPLFWGNGPSLAHPVKIGLGGEPMTDAEWLSAEFSTPMLEHLRKITASEVGASGFARVSLLA